MRRFNNTFCHFWRHSVISKPLAFTTVQSSVLLITLAQTFTFQDFMVQRRCYVNSCFEKLSSMRLGALLIVSFQFFCLMTQINWDNPLFSKSKCVFFACFGGLSRHLSMKLKCTLVQALRFCIGRTAHRGSRGIVLPFHENSTRSG